MTAKRTNFLFKLLAHPERIIEFKQNGHCHPIGAEIYISNRCNLDCNFCDSAGIRSRKNAESPFGDLMNPSLFHLAVRELFRFGIESLTFSGGGEPATHPDFLECAIAAARFFPIGVYTNATLLSQEQVEFLRERASFVVCSLDSVDREDYLRLKGTDLFNVALGKIEALTGGHAEIGLSVLITPETANPAFIERAYALHQRLHTTYLLIRPVRFLRPKFWNPDFVAWLASFVNSHADVECKLDAFNLNPVPPLRAGAPCFASHLTCVILPNGAVVKCVNNLQVLGFLQRDALEEIWTAERRIDEQCSQFCRGYLTNLAMEHSTHDSFA